MTDVTYRQNLMVLVEAAQAMYFYALTQAKGEMLDPTVRELVGLTSKQYRKYSPERQVRLTNLRKKLWTETKPSKPLQVLLFLCEVPRIAHKTHGKEREAGIFYGSRSEIERDGRAVVLRESALVPGVRNCLRRALQADGRDRTLDDLLEVATRQSRETFQVFKDVPAVAAG